MKSTTSLPAETGRAGDDPQIEAIADDRLTGSEAIGHYIDPSMSPRTVRQLLEDGHWPCWREGRQFVASKAALREHWREMTRGFSPQPPKREEAA